MEKALAITSESVIEDSRAASTFRTVTFSGYAKRDVLRDWAVKSIDNKPEIALRWCAELIASGLYKEWREAVVMLYCQYVNTANPALPTYLAQVLQTIDTHVQRVGRLNILDMRNSYSIRVLTGEMTAVLCQATKRRAYATPKMDEKAFDLATLTQRCKAVSTQWIDRMILAEDPPELKIVGNEFMTALVAHDLERSMYWFMWMRDWETRMRRRTGAYACGTRAAVGVDPKHTRSLVWFLWACIFNVAKNWSPAHPFLGQLEALYALSLNESVNGRPQTELLRAAIAIFCEHWRSQPTDYVVCRDTLAVRTLLRQVDSYYTEITQNSVVTVPATLASATVPSGATAAATKPKKGKEDKDAALIARLAAMDELTDMMLHKH
jgi:hypothetical protein